MSWDPRNLPSCRLVERVGFVREGLLRKRWRVNGEVCDTAFYGLLAEEYAKLLRADNRDVHDDSKATTLPIAREIVRTCVLHRDKPPWYIDFLNLNLDNHDLPTARSRIRGYLEAFDRDGTRLTGPADFAT